jgi:hypothetical protein
MEWLWLYYCIHQAMSAGPAWDGLRGAGATTLGFCAICAWLLPLAAFGLVILDHGLSNYIGDLGRHTAPFLVSALHALLLRGQLAVIVLLGSIAAVLVLEQRMLHWASARDRHFPAIPLSVLRRELRWPLSWAGLYHLQEVSEYLRSRRSAYYTLWVWRHGGADAEHGAEMAATLSTLGLNAGLLSNDLRG